MPKRRRTEPASAPSPTTDGRLVPVATAYASIDGYTLARDAKRAQREKGTFLDGLTYGEVRPEAFATALAWVAPVKGESFVDLGSGTGIATLTAAALYPLASATGVEIMRPLHEAARRALAACREELLAEEVRLLCADALAHPWTDCDIVFVTLTCFTDEQAEAVRAGAERLRVGARIIVTSRALESDSLRLLRRDSLPYGKGSLLFLAYERV